MIVKLVPLKLSYAMNTRLVYLLPIHYFCAYTAVRFLRAKAATALARQVAIAILYVRPSVRLSSVTRVDQSKTVQARITKFLPSAAWMNLVLGTVKLSINSKGVTPNEGAK